MFAKKLERGRYTVKTNTSSNASDRGVGADRPIWLVLGGGALKGLAHIGVWKALRELEIPVAGVVGTSIGAIVGAGLLTGRSTDELEGVARGLRRRDITRLNPWLLWPFGVKQKSAFRGKSTRSFIRDFLAGAGWDDLSLPLCVNAVDLGSAECVWFGHRGDTSLPLADAVYASSALPVLYPPLETGERVLVDGGLIETMPIGRAVEMGAGEVIAVNAGAAPETDPEKVLDRGLVGLNQRMFVIMSERRRREALERDYGVPLRVVRPELGHRDGFDFSGIDFFLEEGYRATMERFGDESSAARPS